MGFSSTQTQLGPFVEAIDETIDHLRGPAAAPIILIYGDYQCPRSQYAFREIERAEQQLGDAVCIAFRHFPRQHLHPRSLAAAAAVEAAALQGRFWEMHDLILYRQWGLEDRDLRRYAAELELDLARFHLDRFGPKVLARIGRDVATGVASGEIRDTPTVFVDGVVHRGGCNLASLLTALADEQLPGGKTLLPAQGDRHAFAHARAGIAPSCPSFSDSERSASQGIS